MVTSEIQSKDKWVLLRQKNLIESFLKQTTFQLSSFSFVNIFVWSDFFDFRFETIEGNLCVFAENEIGSFLYLPPLGSSISDRALTECFEMMKKSNCGRPVTRIENIDGQQLQKFADGQFTSYRKSSEFVYDREEIAQLKGNKYKSKRSTYNHFVKNFSCEYLPFSIDMRKECEKLYEVWANDKKAKNQDPVYLQMIDDNRLVHRLALEYYGELKLIGRVVKINNEIKAYTFGYVLKDDTFCILFEIADVSVKGLPMFIFSEFCKDEELRRFRWINGMDDFEMDAVARTKETFHPVHVYPCYTATQKQ